MRILIIDCNFYLHRCWFTLRTNRPIEEALPYALIGLIFKDACAVKATHILVAFDGPSVFRYKIFPEYKANRKKENKGGEIEDGQGKEIYSYLPNVREALNSVGLTWIQPAEYEADDVLASAACQYKGRVILGSKDKDGYQSLRNNVVAYDSTADPPRYIDMAYAEKSKGVAIDKMIMYQTLIGDKIDNIPCLKTPAVAKKIINQWGSFKAWYDNATKDDRIWLRANQVKLSLNRQLVEMKTDLLLPKLETLKVPKLVRKDMPKSFYAYQDMIYPKSKGLFKR